MKSVNDVLKKYVFITIGTAIAGFSLSCFLAPNSIIAGGVSGISTIINYFAKIPLGLVLLSLNIPIFIWGVAKLGKSLGIATVYGTIMLSVFIDVFSIIGCLTDDMLLSSVFGGLLNGVGYGLVFMSNATTGGVDIIAKIIKNKRRHLKLGSIILFVDLFVILLAMLAYKNINTGLYSIISLWLSSRILDVILEGFNYAKLSFIISDYSDVISKDINIKLARGATLLTGFGSYTGRAKNVILCTIKKSEIPVLKDIIKSVDKDAFVLITDAREVLGEGFLKY